MTKPDLLIFVSKVNFCLEILLVNNCMKGFSPGEMRIRMEVPATLLRMCIHLSQAILDQGCFYVVYY